MNALCEYAKSLQEKEELSVSEKAWIYDFVQYIQKIFAIERSSTEQLKQDFERETNKPSTSTFVPNHAQANHKQTAVITEESTPLTTPKTTRPSQVPPPPPRTATRPRNLSISSDSQVPTIDLNKLVHKPEKFSGDRDKAQAWLEDYEAAIQSNRWSQQIAVYYFSTFLTKQAKKLVPHHSDTERC